MKLRRCDQQAGAPCPGGRRFFGPKASLLALVLLDMTVLGGCLAVVVAGRYWLGGQFSPWLYISLAWAPLLYLCIALVMGIYPGYLRTPPEEIKNLSRAVSLFFLVVGLLTFLSHEAAAYSRAIFLISWALALLALPLARVAARKLFSRWFCWGYPCVLIGRAALVSNFLQHLQTSERTERLRIVGAVVEPGALPPEGIPDFPFDDLEPVVTAMPECHALILVDPLGVWPPSDATDRLSVYFRHVLLSSTQTAQLSQWTRGVDLAGLTLLTSQFKLLDPCRMAIKRIFDICFCLTAGVAILPGLLVLALLVKRDSPGPIFFTQRRLGQGGRPFHILKFRTMRQDAMAELNRLLRQDPDLARQWNENQKIDQDPRITRIGWFLRKTSLDELPQLVNVLRGEMSLVGPRPIVDDEILKYGPSYEVYTRVKPGMTGLWQVSGRNDTDYARRVALDVAYVRNWSVYTDLWLLTRTVQEVIRLSGR